MNAAAWDIGAAGGVILTFHRLLPEAPSGGFCPTRALSITPAAFRRLVRGVRDAGCDIVSLGEAERRRRRGLGSAGKFVCLTFDDGYRDTVETAQPLCAELGVPLTVFAASGFVFGTAVMWWLGLARAIAVADEICLDDGRGERRWRSCSTAEKRRAYRGIEALLGHSDRRRREALIRELEGRCGTDFAGISAAAAMTPALLQQLAACANVEVGAHTVSHPWLSALPAAEAAAEITGSRRALEKEIGRPVVHFAYPFGTAAAAGRREFALCAEAGFVTGATTAESGLYAWRRQSPYSLPRLGIDAATADGGIAARLCGISPALRRMQRQLLQASGIGPLLRGLHVGG